MIDRMLKKLAMGHPFCLRHPGPWGGIYLRMSTYTTAAGCLPKLAVPWRRRFKEHSQLTVQGSQWRGENAGAHTFAPGGSQPASDHHQQEHIHHSVVIAHWRSLPPDASDARCL